jgi:hypothetical protein
MLMHVHTCLCCSYVPGLERIRISYHDVTQSYVQEIFSDSSSSNRIVLIISLKNHDKYAKGHRNDSYNVAWPPPHPPKKQQKNKTKKQIKFLVHFLELWISNWTSSLLLIMKLFVLLGNNKVLIWK